VAKPRDTYTYKFKVGNKVLHGGITKDPDRREQEHQANIAEKGHLLIIGNIKTEDGARKWEEDNGFTP
jgi:hypothetical protein